MFLQTIAEATQIELDEHVVWNVFSGIIANRFNYGTKKKRVIAANAFFHAIFIFVSWLSSIPSVEDLLF